MSVSISRKRFVTTLGAAGLGLTMTGVGRAPVTLAQEATTPSEQDDGPMEQQFEQREELYAEFTAALANELGIANADEVDAGIRKALMAVIDARVGEGVLTAGQAEALKTLVATSDVPFGPLVMMGPSPGRFIRIQRGEHFGPGWDEDDRGARREKSDADDTREIPETSGEESGQ